MSENVGTFLNAIGANYTEEELSLSRIESKIISQLLKYRKNRGLSQKQFAELLGMNLAKISKLENGEINLNLKELHHISWITGLSLVIGLKKEAVE